MFSWLNGILDKVSCLRVFFNLLVVFKIWLVIYGWRNIVNNIKQDTIEPFKSPIILVSGLKTSKKNSIPAAEHLYGCLTSYAL